MNEKNTENTIHGAMNGEDHGKHMTPRVKNVFKKANAVSLTPEEKHQGAQHLRNFMGANSAAGTKNNKTKQSSPYFSPLSAFLASVSLSLDKKVFVPVVAVLILILATGTTYAASEALPGDVLYPLKININEKVETFLAVRPEARAKIAAQHAATRLVEAEKLAERGKLDAETKASLEAEFSRQAKDAEDQTEELRAEGNTEAADSVSLEFEGSLNRHHNAIEILAGKTEASSTERQSLVNLKKAVQVKIDTYSKRRMEIENEDAATSNNSKDKKRVNETVRVLPRVSAGEIEISAKHDDENKGRPEGDAAATGSVIKLDAKTGDTEKAGIEGASSDTISGSVVVKKVLGI